MLLTGAFGAQGLSFTASKSRGSAAFVQQVSPFRRKRRKTNGHGVHNLWRSHFGLDEHPLATYFVVRQGFPGF